MDEGLAKLQPSFALDLSGSFYNSRGGALGGGTQFLRTPNRFPETSRKYQPGDAIKAIDWRAFGRTEQLMVKEKRRESELKVGILVEEGSTMDWPDDTVAKAIKSQAVVQTKYQFAARISLNLAFNYLKQNDNVKLGVLRWKDGEETSDSVYTVKLGSASDVIAFFQGLDFMNKDTFNFSHSNGFVPIAEYFTEKFDVLYVFSDLIAAGFETWMENIPNAKKYIFAHVLDDKECEDDWMKADSEYFESGNFKEYQGRTLIDSGAYKMKLANWLSTMQRQIYRSGAHYMFLSPTHSELYYRSEIARVLAE